MSSDTPFLDLRRSNILLVALLAVSVVLLVTSCYFHYTRYVVGSYNRTLLLLFDFNTEGNVPTWFSAMILFSCGILGLLISHNGKSVNARDAFMWTAIGCIFLWLSLDETASIHELMIEPIQDRYEPQGCLHYGWVVPGAAVVVAFILLFFNFIRRLLMPVRTFFVSGFALYICGCLVMECIGAKYDTIHGQNNLGYALITGLEEWLEMIGAILLAYSFLRQLLVLQARLPSKSAS